MSALLAPADRHKIVQCSRLLASNHDGEVLAAARAATRLLRARGLDWADIIRDPDRQTSSADWASSPPPQPTPMPAWKQTVAACLAHPDRLSEWEAGFLAGLRRFPYLSRKQAWHLARIAERLGVSP